MPDLSEYCQKYYGKNAAEVEEIFGLIFTELHPDPILKFDDEAFIKQSSSIELRAKKILDRLDQVISETKDSSISERLVRLRTYVEFHQIYIQAFSNGKPADLERLINYSAEHPDQDMVLMYPEYIRWRNGEYF